MSNEEQERCETAAAADLLFLYMYDFLIPTMTYTYLAQCSKYVFFVKKMQLREFVLISFYYWRFLKISKEHMKSAFIGISKGLLGL